MSLLDLCKEIIAYNKNGDPVRDVIDSSEYRETELLVLAKHYVASAR